MIFLAGITCGVLWFLLFFRFWEIQLILINKNVDNDYWVRHLFHFLDQLVFNSGNEIVLMLNGSVKYVDQ